MSRETMTEPDIVRWGIRITGGLAVVIGAFWLFVWFLGFGAKWSAAGVLTVKTNTSLAMFLSGASLLILRPGKTGGSRRWIGAFLSAFVLLIGVLTLSEYIFGWSLGIDQLLAEEPQGAVATASPNRMGLPASLSFILLSIGLLSFAARRCAITPYLGLTVCLINLVPAVGFIYGIGPLYGTVVRQVGIAWPTVVALISLGIGLVMVRWDGGPMALLLRDDPGGELLRRMLPVTILLPLALGFLRVLGQQRALYGTAQGTGLLIITLILVFSVILWRSAAGLSRTVSAQREAEWELRESEERYRALINASSQVLYRMNPDWSEMTQLKGSGFLADTEKPNRSWLQEYIHPDDQDMVLEAIREVVRTGSVFELEHRVLRADGTLGWTFSRAVPVRNAAGKIVEWFGSASDITERKEAEQELRATYDSESHIAEVLQNAIAPLVPSIGIGYRISSVYIPAFAGEKVGGDFYDVFRLSDGRVGILIGDVSGKGVEAAAHAASTRSTVRALTYSLISPGQSLTSANNVLHSQNLDGFVTVFLAVLDTERGSICYATAGHPPPAVLRTGGNVEFLMNGSIPLGALPGIEYRQNETYLDPGDSIILYTDGVSEARIDNGVLFGYEGIESVLRQLPGEEPDHLCRTLLDAAINWAEGILRDDTAIVIVQRVSQSLEGSSE
ncbi:MAG: SpoIIE family protein phosphatase [Armatimonadota bacterium]